MSEEIKELARSFLKQINLEGKAPAELCTADFKAHVGVDIPRDLETFQHFNGIFYDGFSDWILTIEDMVAEGDKVAFRLMTQATHTAEFMGIPASGRQVLVSSIGFGRISGGKIAEWWVSPDRIALFRQLGSVPSM